MNDAERSVEYAQRKTIPVAEHIKSDIKNSQEKPFHARLMVGRFGTAVPT